MDPPSPHLPFKDTPHPGWARCPKHGGKVHVRQYFDTHHRDVPMREVYWDCCYLWRPVPRDKSK
jgi:hypothetical protein